MNPPRAEGARSSVVLRGFTLVELLVAIAIIAVLACLSYAATVKTIASARAVGSASNLRQLALANLSYVADHDGYFCPAQDLYNLVRWHGARTAVGAPFDPTKGFLAPYLGGDRKVKMCPLFAKMLRGDASFEDGTGGYGYNATYIGGTPADMYQPIHILNIKHPDRTVMFTTTAFAMPDGVQEYPYCEPYEWVDPNYQLSGSLQPSVHFRANGGALVAWCDGHVTRELPSRLGGTDYYGGDSKRALIGWFGPTENNGYWNPDFNP